MDGQDGENELEGLSMRNGSQSRRSETPQGSDYERLPKMITAGGKTRSVSLHARNETHLCITAEIIEHVLDNWVIRGIMTDVIGRQSRCHLAFVLQLGKMVRVAVSMDDTTIITAFRDTTATQKWRNLDIGYFDRKYRSLEVRDASSL